MSPRQRRILVGVAAALALAGVLVAVGCASPARSPLRGTGQPPGPDRLFPLAPVADATPTATPLAPSPPPVVPPTPLPAVPPPPPAPPAEATPEPILILAPASVPTFNQQFIALTNGARAQETLPPLAADPALTTAAQDYARLLALNNWLNHIGPDGSTLESRAAAAGYLGWAFLAEVIYFGSFGDSPDMVVTAWLTASGHREVLLTTQATEIGAGCYHHDGRLWCVEVFGAR